MFTNQAGTGLDASGNLLPGWDYMTYSNGKGVGTPIQRQAAASTYAPGSTGANLTGVTNQDYLQSSVQPWQQQAQQVASRVTPNSVAGPSQQAQAPSGPYYTQPLRIGPAQGGMYGASPWGGMYGGGFSGYGGGFSPWAGPYGFAPNQQAFGSGMGRFGGYGQFGGYGPFGLARGGYNPFGGYGGYGRGLLW